MNPRFIDQMSLTALGAARGFGALPAIFVLLTMLLSGSPAQAAWDIKQFRFEVSDRTGGIKQALGLDSTRQKTILDYELYLSQVAVGYEAMGFPEPRLPVVRGHDGQPAFQVVVFEYPDDDPIARAGFREDLTASLQLDLSRAFKGDGTATPRTYDDLAHELFHNVQRAYQQSWDADRGFWIMEGQAQAMGMEMARSLRGVDVHRATNRAYWVGARNYWKPIDDSPGFPGIAEMDYRASSFWRYVAERYAASQRGQKAGVAIREADYSVLAKLWEQPYRGAGSDLEWLDRGMREVFKIGLARIYANFVATHAGYMPVRFEGALTVPEEQAMQSWLKMNFGGCEVHSITATQPFAAEPLSVAENAARCLRAELFADGLADLAVQVRSETMEALQALRIGTAGGDKVGSPHRIESPVGGGYIGLWEFSVPAGEPLTFVIANMSDDPAGSLPFRGEAVLTTNYWESNLTAPQGPKAPSSKPGATPGSASTGPATSRERAADELASGLSDLSNRTSSGTTTNFGTRRRFCSEPFAKMACGPTLGIGLELMPGPLMDTYKITGSGGALSQVMNQFTAIADHGVLATDRGLEDAKAKMKAIEGSSVNILLPAFDYGFTGTFNNARITVHGGDRHGTLEAIGPEDSQPGPGWSFWSSGRVRIDEFTPLLLRGSYSARLVDTDAIDYDSLGDDPTLPIHREIEGRFVISAPWRGDRRVEIIQPQGEAGVESALQDMAEAFPGMAFDREALGLDSVEEQGSATAHFPRSPLESFPSCDCDQPLKAIAKECRPACRSLFFARGHEKKRQENLGKATQ